MQPFASSLSFLSVSFIDSVYSYVSCEFDKFGADRHLLCKLRDTPAARFYR